MCQQFCFRVWTYAIGINFCKGYWQPAHLVLVISDSVSLHWVFYFPWIRWSIHFPYLYHIDFFNHSQIHVICSCSSLVTLFNVLFPSVTTPNIFIRKTLGEKKKQCKSYLFFCYSFVLQENFDECFVASLDYTLFCSNSYEFGYFASDAHFNHKGG